VILAALLHERVGLAGIEATDMTRRALGFITRMGPVTDQDRWEEDRGINAFTLAVTIAALVAGAVFLAGSEKSAALDLADNWNARIERWLYARHTPLGDKLGVAGHYVRTAPAEILIDPAAMHEKLAIKNRARDPGLSAATQISTDFLQLVRYGLRSPDDPFVKSSVAVIDAVLRVDTPTGPAWHRYNGDGYGEHSDGRAFDGTGAGRAWPLLTGERGHYELLAGRDAKPFLVAMSAMAGPSGMLPEQVWDNTAIPGRRLSPGKPTGSAMPLAWTHAEFVKLMLSNHLRAAFDCPRSVCERYRGRAPVPSKSIWSENAPVTDFLVGSDLRVDLSSAALIRWRTDDGAWHEATTQPGLPGVYSAVLPTRTLSLANRIEFTWQRIDTGTVNPDYVVVARDAD
jgi:glucoamylase